MQNKFIKLVIAFIILLTMNSCEVIEGIFEAGMGVGIFLVIAVIAIIIYIITRFSKKDI